jgi:hypothetical protein
MLGDRRPRRRGTTPRGRRGADDPGAVRSGADDPVPTCRRPTRDDETSLHERIKAVERRLYPQTIRAVLADPSLLDQEVERP